MKDKTNLWRLYNTATAYGKKPSEFVQLETEIAAWALDEACLVIGRRFENMLNNGEDPFSDQLSVSSNQKFASAPKRKIKKVSNQ